MIPQVQQEIVRRLGGLCELSPGVRVGQLVAHLGFLAEDAFGRGLWDLDDEQLLEVIRHHETELTSRQSNVAGRGKGGARKRGQKVRRYFVRRVL
jgi:hypothetical protein